MSCLVLVPLFVWLPWLRRLVVEFVLASLLRSRPPRRHWARRRRLQYFTEPSPMHAAPQPVAASGRSHWRKKPEWVVREALRLAVFLRSGRLVAAVFNRIHGQRMTIGHTWTCELLRKQAHALRLRRRAMRGAPPKPVPVGRALAVDLTSVPAPCGEHWSIFAAIDQGSRAALRLKVVAHKCTWSLLGQLCVTIADHGLPGSIRSDNEGMFTGKLWKAAFKWAGVRHERIRVASPWENGRVERFFGTLKPLLRKLTLTSPMQLQGALDEFGAFYNHVRVHQSLGGLTPAEAWRGETFVDVRRRVGQGQWVQACGGLLVGYRLRC